MSATFRVSKRGRVYQLELDELVGSLINHKVDEYV